MAAVMAQDEKYVNRKYEKVLDVANGTNDSSSSESEFGEDQDSDFEPYVDLESLSSTQSSSVNQNGKATEVSSSQPLTKQPQPNKSTTQVAKSTTQVGQVKKQQKS
jgi:hypothetical protein